MPETYRLKVLSRAAISSLTLDKLTPVEISSYRDQRLRQVSSASVRRELVVLRHCLEVARREWGFDLPENPVARITMPQHGQSRERRITTDELERLRNALAGTRNGFVAHVLHFAVHTGMRRGEILSLRWPDIDINGCIAYLPETKNGHPRTVPLSPSAIAALPARPIGANADHLVFPLSPNALRLAWERLKCRAKIEDLRFHDLRHEAISRFFEMGLSVPEVSLISGHKDARMLFRYTHLKAENVAQKLQKITGQDAT